MVNGWIKTNNMAQKNRNNEIEISIPTKIELKKQVNK